MFRYGQFLFTGLILSFIGWGGLALLVYFTLPTLGPRWLFYFLLLSGLTGISLPILAFLHMRFPSVPPADGAVVLRQAIWVGVFGDIVVWLKLGRILNPTLVVFIATGFGLIEFLLRLRERSRWKPKDPIHG